MSYDDDVRELKETQNNVVKVGQVSSINPAEGTCKVVFPASDGMVSHDLAIIYPCTQDIKFYWMPDVGSQVLCVFDPEGLENGYVLGCFYSSEDKPPVTDPNKTHIKYKDGTTIDYDMKQKKLTVVSVGSVDVTATEQIKLTCPDIQIAGNVTVAGNLQATNIKTDRGIDVDAHTHSGVQAGNDNTGAAQ